MGSLISGIGSYIGGQQAASAAEDAANKQLEMYYVTRQDLAPYNTTGQNALTGAYNLASGSPTGGGPDYVTLAQQNLPGQMTQNQLEQTPGYQWQLSEGLKATQSAAAARGLGVSGASLKGAATYASGLASANYQNQFTNAQTQFKDYIDLNTNQQTNLSNQYKRYYDLASLGETAASATGTAGTQAAANYGTSTVAAGAAESAATTGLFKGIGSTVNQLSGYGLTTSNDSSKG